MTASTQTWQLVAHGRVQGVGYRGHCADRARALGLGGWVRNRMDGTVEVIATGSPEQLDALRAWMEQGPPAAQVSRVAVKAAPRETFDGFEWRPTA